MEIFFQHAAVYKGDLKKISLSKSGCGKYYPSRRYEAACIFEKYCLCPFKDPSDGGKLA